MSEPAEKASSSKRRGLVLAGGGARGAYAFGCMIALKRLGYEFKVVSGTSVGALNAALWSKGSLVKGFALWKGLSFKSVYPVRMRSLGLPRLLVWTIASVYVSLHLIGATSRGYKNPATVVLAPLLALAHAGLCLALFSYLSSALFEASWLRWEYAYIVTIGYSVILYSSLRRFSKSATGYFILGILIVVWGAWFSALASYARPFSTQLIVIYIVGTLLFAIAVAAIGQVLLRMLRVLGAATIFSTTPLRNTIDAILSSKDWKCMTFVTSARSADIIELRKPIEWEPPTLENGVMRALRENLGYWFPASVRNINKTVRWVNTPGDHQTVIRPAVVRSWIAVYTDISYRGRAADYLMASAALPFGLTSPVMMEDARPSFYLDREDRFVDGGVVDNVPWLPLVEFGLDELIIVLLEPFPDHISALSSLDMTDERWIRHRLFTFLEKLTCEVHMDFEIYKADRWMADFLQKKHAKFQRETASFNKPVIRIIYPRSHLGGFINGTLRFDGRYAKKLIRLGIQDTYRAVSEWASSS